jgi:hypothetical protein
MNKRLQQLADKAADYAAFQCTMDDAGLQQFNDMYMSKYAQLIVEECVEACADHDMESFGIFPIRALMVTRSCQKNLKRWINGEGMTHRERQQLETDQEIERLEKRILELRNQ